MNTLREYFLQSVFRQEASVNRRSGLDRMRGSTCPILKLEERGDGAGIFAGSLQRVGGHDPKGPGKMDSRYVDGSLQFFEGRKRLGIADG